jgi:hypothetical protein
VYLTFVIGSEPRANDMPVLGKGYKRKRVYFTFVTERELLAARWGLCSAKSETRKSVYLTFVTTRRRSESVKQRQEAAGSEEVLDR